MIDWLVQSPVEILIVFCRVGSALAVLPGYSSLRIPVQVKLFFALLFSVCVTLLLPPIGKSVTEGAGIARLIEIIVNEILIGLTFGLLARLVFEALQFCAVAISNFVGFSGTLGAQVDGAEPIAAVSSLITLTATMLIFVGDLHVIYLQGVLASYDLLPLASGFKPGPMLGDLMEVLSKYFIVALQLCSPFLMFSVLINTLFGIVNKLIPQIPIYFVSLPFILLGGLILLYFTVSDLLNIFYGLARNWTGS